MTCPCGRDNEPRRRYCGGCGERVATCCARCQFVNGCDDCFCGGCGDELVAAVAEVGAHGTRSTRGTHAPAAGRPAAAAAMLPAAAPTRAAADMISAEELAVMLGVAATPTAATLPSVVSQDDLDRLFGAVS